MRSFIIAGALAAMVSAAPLQERAAVTVTDVTDVYTTVWEDEAAAEPTATKVWGHGHKHYTAVEAATTVVVTPTPEAAAAWTPAPAAPSAAYSSPAANAPAAAPSVAAAASSPSAPDSYSQTVIDHHNAHRANHSASPITWDAGLAATAQTIGESCVYAHNV
jgi:uncharacterized protein YkwD